MLPKAAIESAMASSLISCDMDVLVLEDCILYKAEQPELSETERTKYVESFTLD